MIKINQRSTSELKKNHPNIGNLWYRSVAKSKGRDQPEPLVPWLVMSLAVTGKYSHYILGRNLILSPVIVCGSVVSVVIALLVTIIISTVASWWSARYAMPWGGTGSHNKEILSCPANFGLTRAIGSFVHVWYILVRHVCYSSPSFFDQCCA